MVKFRLLMLQLDFIVLYFMRQVDREISNLLFPLLLNVSVLGLQLFKFSFHLYLLVFEFCDILLQFELFHRDC